MNSQLWTSYSIFYTLWDLSRRYLAVLRRNLTTGPIINGVGFYRLFALYFARKPYDQPSLNINNSKFEGPPSSFLQNSYIATSYMRNLHETPNMMHGFRVGSLENRTFNKKSQRVKKSKSKLSGCMYGRFLKRGQISKFHKSRHAFYTLPVQNV